MKKENNAIVVTSIIAGVVLLIAILAMTTFNNAVPSGKNSVTVQGSASIDVVPDLVSVYYQAQGKAETTSAAKDKADEIYNDLVSSLAVKGIDSGELKTQSFNVYPNVYYENGKQKQDGYLATYSLKLELSSEKINKVGDAIDAGVNANASISYINFELTPELQSQKKAESLELASKDAKIKAEAVASGFGKSVGSLVSVEVDNFGYQPWRLYAASEGSVASADEAKTATANITPTDQTIDASVTATYKLR